MLLTNQGTSRTILSNYQVAMQTMSYTPKGVRRGKLLDRGQTSGLR